MYELVVVWGDTLFSHICGSVKEALAWADLYKVADREGGVIRVWTCNTKCQRVWPIYKEM